jgi:hypothetical protein
MMKPQREPLPRTSVIGWRGGVPIIAAEIVGAELRFHCDHCGEQHIHGLGDGLRVARCLKPGGPFAKGYFLKAYARTAGVERANTEKRQ